ncbi:hypothetical protein LCI18_006106 [Fusarium solani-melongenae]|uniref:Uncharacterized protein n=1 Tax=Fusarium solani subsp. cucurbitae TaxID=2747967 RepID=A0ACD3Z1V3_FUSSC|nr:hypothetical protein LCI18_006106 [Fusarium solani-melongenae]
MHKHNVVIGCLPSGVYGNTSAACVARDMVRSFPNLRFALMVGIGGGAPTPERDIRLGDVVVSEPKGELGEVLQYDLGKRLLNGEFKRAGQLNAPPRVLLGALPEVRRRHNDPRKRHSMDENLARMDDMPEYSRPTSDNLYRVDSRHHSGRTCDQYDPAGFVERPLRASDRAIAIHYSTIASGNSVMKNPTERDRYANDPELNVLCFEMEAAGLMNNFPCLVIGAGRRGGSEQEVSDVKQPLGLFASLGSKYLLLTCVSKRQVSEQVGEIVKWIVSWKEGEGPLPWDDFPQELDDLRAVERYLRKLLVALVERFNLSYVTTKAEPVKE